MLETPSIPDDFVLPFAPIERKQSSLNQGYQVVTSVNKCFDITQRFTYKPGYEGTKGLKTMVNLTLCPVINKMYWISHDHVTIEISTDLRKEIKTLAISQIPGHGFTCFRARIIEAHSEDGVEGYGQITEDALGNQLRWLTAGELKSVFADVMLQNWRLTATIAWVNQFPDDWPFVLYWN